MSYDSKEDTENHIEKVREYLYQSIAILKRKIQEHDQSKLEEEEKPFFDKYTPLLSGVEYGSEKYMQFLKEMEPALTHHYANNRHHPEYFEHGMRDMNLLDLVEMICDWIASCERYKNGNLAHSIEYNQKRFGYSDDLKNIFLNTARLFNKCFPDDNKEETKN